MVERLKKAIDKARAHREQVLAGAVPPSVSPEERPPDPVETTVPADSSPWAALEEVTLDVAHLKRRRVVSYQKNDPAHVVFDVLRTRLLKVFKDNGWSRIAITSPTRGCGKTFVAANLAFSLARQAECRTVLIDMDLKRPHLAGTLGLTTPRQIEWYLTGQMQPEAYFRRVGPNLALGLNTERVRDSAELIQDECTAQALAQMCELYRPDAVIYDLPPMLVSHLRLAGGGNDKDAVDMGQKADGVVADQHRRQVVDHRVGPVELAHPRERLGGALFLDQFGGIADPFRVEPQCKVRPYPPEIGLRLRLAGEISLDLAQCGEPEGLGEAGHLQVHVDQHGPALDLAGKAKRQIGRDDCLAAAFGR